MKKDKKEEIVITRGETNPNHTRGFGFGNNLSALRKGLANRRAKFTHELMDVAEADWKKFIAQKFQEAFEKGEINLTKEFMRICTVPASMDESADGTQSGSLAQAFAVLMEEKIGKE